MNKIAVIALLLCTSLVVGCATEGRYSNYANTYAYEREMRSIDRQLYSGELSPLRHAEIAAALARQYFPQDYVLHSLRDYKVLLGRRLDRGEISRDEFDYLWSERRNEVAARREREYATYEAQASQQRAAAAAMVLQRTGDAFRNSYPSPTVRCTSTPLGYSVSTTCY